jgi:hypothetical protein
MAAHGFQFRWGPPADHHAEPLTQLRSQPALDRIRVRRRHDQYGLIRPGPEDPRRDRGTGLSQITEIEVRVRILMPWPAARRRRAGRYHPAGGTTMPTLGTRLALNLDFAS